MNKRRLIVLVIQFMVCLVNAQSADSKRIMQYNIEKQNVAIQGYDPVSYFINELPKKGKTGISFFYKGIQYLFTNERNKSTFIENPDKYEPAYGGWCAYAMGIDGEKVKIDPETYKIVEGKLNLFYNFGFTNTLKPWNKNELKLMRQAVVNWNKTIQ